MKTRIAINLFLLSVIFLTANLHADWKSDWEQTVAAAKQEGRLNLYVGRYGQAALLDEFKRDYPKIKIASVNGTGDQLATRIAAEVRRENHRGHYSAGPTRIIACFTAVRCSTRSSPPSYFPKWSTIQMVRWQAYLHPQPRPIHLCLHRAARRSRPVLQFQPRQRERI